MAIKLVLSDLDGTLLDSAKRITEAAAQTVVDLRKKGILFALVSGRPPFGMRMYSDLLRVDLPISGFNGGEITTPDFQSINRLCLPPETALEIAEFFRQKNIQYWIYRGSDWLVTNGDAPHVEKESRSVAFAPTVLPDLDGRWDGITKIVGVSDDHRFLAECEMKGQKLFTGKVNMARSQSYYLDVTHPQATKEFFVDYLSKTLSISREEIATIGDMPSDVPMFQACGMSIAMGNASDEVKAKARVVTRSNTEEGFALAMQSLVLAQMPFESEGDKAKSA